ncbi:MAG TPA: DUF1592 domain-containing protein, partial [Myxococcota bacterium]
MRRLLVACALAATPLLLPLACFDGDTDDTPDDVEPEPASPATPVRRLTTDELNRTLRDLFPLSVVPVIAITEDRGKDFVQETVRQVVSDLYVEQLRAGINVVTEAVVADRAGLLPREPAGVDDEEAVVDELLQSLLVRAFRRPVAADERARYVDFFVARRADDDATFPSALTLTLQAVLQSPQFLYRLELDDDATGAADADGRVAVTSIEMATRLSYFLLGSMPDQALLQAGIDGALSTTEGIAAQTRRLLAEPKSRDAILSFHTQWLDFDRILSSNKDPQRFGGRYNEFVRQAMRREADQFIDMLFDGTPTLTAMLTTRQTR